MRRRPVAVSAPSQSTPGDDCSSTREDVGKAAAAATKISEGTARSSSSSASSVDDGFGDVGVGFPPECLFAATVLAVLLSVASLSLLVRGLVVGPDLHNGGECDMTWSHPKFLPLEVSPSSPPSPPLPPRGGGHGEINSHPSRSSSSASASARRYRLLKFIDQRDPRHWHLYDPSAEANGDDGLRTLTMEDNWCLQRPPGPNATSASGGEGGRTRTRTWTSSPPHANPGRPVLYVPGHWGEYKQARSLGAHGLGWTRRAETREEVRRRADGLRDGTVSSDPGAVAEEGSGGDGREEDGDGDSFLFDVYAVDFDGEGAALHGGRLVRQAAYVARAVEILATACRSPSVTIVAHSVGGVVARSVPLLHPETARLIRNVVTVASPHRYMPWGFDATVREFWGFVNGGGGKGSSEGRRGTADTTTVVSISPGIRDELIPPDACEIDGGDGISVMSSSIMYPRSAPSDSKHAKYALADKIGLGMDHKASCWCHNLLVAVRRVIRSMAAAEEKGEDDSRKRRRIERLLEGMGARGSYGDAVAAQEALLQATYGPWTSLALRAAVPYRLGILVVLYVILAALYPLMLVSGYRKGADVKKAGESKRSRVFSSVATGTICAVYIVLAPLAVVSHWFLRRSGALGLTPSHCSDRVVEFLLASWAALTHAAVMHGFLPGIGWVLERQKWWERGKWRGDGVQKTTESSWVKEREEREGRTLRGVVSPIAVTFVVVAAVLVGYHLFMGERMVLNFAALKAICFAALVCHSLFVSISFSCRQIEDPTSLRLCRSASSFLLVAIPFLLAGKMIFALSLLTPGGQADAELLAKFRRMPWGVVVSVEALDNASEGLWELLAMSLWRDDLLATTICLCTLLIGMRNWSRRHCT